MSLKSGNGLIKTSWDYQSLSRKNGWTLAIRSLIHSASVTSMTWLFLRKEEESFVTIGSLIKKTDGRKRACLVAKGFSQVEGIDYNDIISPVVRYELVCLMVALAALQQWHMSSVDVKTAFLLRPRTILGQFISFCLPLPLTSTIPSTSFHQFPYISNCFSDIPHHSLLFQTHY